LKDVISALEKTKGCESLAKATFSFAGFSNLKSTDSNWSDNTFNGINLSWVLINLDGLKANLLIVKSSV